MFCRWQQAAAEDASGRFLLANMNGKTTAVRIRVKQV